MFTSTIISSLGHRCFLAICGAGHLRNGFAPVNTNTLGSVPGLGRIWIQPLSTASRM